MRTIHRWVSIPISVFLGLIGITGVYLQSDIFLEHYFPTQQSAVQVVSMDELPKLLENSLAQMRRAAPGARVASIELSARGGEPHAEVLFASPGAHMQTFDARSGEPPARPIDASVSTQPLRLRLRALAINLHQGGILGVAGGVIGWFCGLALVMLVTTGVMVYVRLYRQRLRLKRRALFWP